MPKNLKVGFTRAGAILERDMKKKVTGPGRVRRKGITTSNSSPFPGVVTNFLRAGISAIVRSPLSGIQLRVGPKADYARFLELGTRFIDPPYAFIGPTWEDKGESAISAIQKQINKPLGPG